MIVCDYTRHEEVCKFISERINVAAIFKDDLAALKQWRTQHPDGIAILLGDYHTDRVRIAMEDDSCRRHACVIYSGIVCLPGFNDTIVLTQENIANQNIILSLDPGEKNLGCAIFRIFHGKISSIQTFVYDTKAFIESDLVSNPKAGATHKTNEALMHLLAYAMTQGKLISVIIERQAAQNTKAAAILSALVMACQMMELEVSVIAPSVKFTKLGLATPKAYANRKDLSVRLVRDLRTNFEINEPGDIPTEYSKIMIPGPKDDDKADAILQGIVKGIVDKHLQYSITDITTMCQGTITKEAKVTEKELKELEE